MLPHKVNHIIHGLNAIECRAAEMRCSCGMCRFTIKSELGAFVREGGFGIGAITTRRMPMQHGISIIEKTCLDKIGFAASTFFCRCTIIPDCALMTGSYQPFLCSDSGGSRSHPKEMMTTTMARLPLNNGLFVWNSIL